MPVIDLGRVIGPQGPQGAQGAQGQRGEQGFPGPNIVGGDTATTLTGVLVGNGNVVGTRAIDAAPTADSTGFATSGGTKVALDTKANQEQLADVETGTTASRPYAVGEYFCWNGLLYRVIAAISSGDTFTPGTNCAAEPEGGFNSLRSVTVNTLSIEATSYITNINQCHAYTVGRTAYVYISCQIEATPVAVINLLKGIPRPYNNTQLSFFTVTSSGATFVLVVKVENGVAYICKGSNNTTTAGWYTGTISYPIA